MPRRGVAVKPTAQISDGRRRAGEALDLRNSTRWTRIAMVRYQLSRSVVALIGAVSLVAIASAPAAQASSPNVKVMTRNMYIGSNLGPIVQATTFEQFLAATAQAFTNAEASDPPGRIRAIAREIADADPTIIGLQEVEFLKKDTEPPTNDGPATPADTVVFDFLGMLLDELRAQGTPYRVVISVPNVSLEFPTALGFDVAVTHRDVVLVEADLPADELSWSNQDSATFAARMTLPTVGGPLTFTRSYNVVDFRANKRPFRLVNTHLESFSRLVRNAQVAELLSGALGDPAARQVLIGNINSDPSESGTNAYDLLAGAGFADSWSQAHPSAAGLTCCFGDLLEPDASAFHSRIDVVLTRNASEAATKARIYGTNPDNRTPSGLWPSDQAGISAEIAP